MQTYEKLRAEHLRAVTLHELCHAFTALPRSEAVMIAFNVNKLFSILPNQKTWDGRATVNVLDDDRHKDSVYGWAGIVGEAIERDRANAVALAWDQYKNARGTVSDTDLRNIECVPEKDRPRTLQSAYDELLGQWDEIKKIQGRTIDVIEGRRLENLTWVESGAKIG